MVRYLKICKQRPLQLDMKNLAAHSEYGCTWIWCIALPSMLVDCIWYLWILVNIRIDSFSN